MQQCIMRDADYLTDGTVRNWLMMFFQLHHSNTHLLKKRLLAFLGMFLLLKSIVNEMSYKLLDPWIKNDGPRRNTYDRTYCSVCNGFSSQGEFLDSLLSHFQELFLIQRILRMRRKLFVI